ncbi:MAG: SNF2-related protein [Gallionella sp.]
MITDYQAKYFAHELTIQHGSDGVVRLSQSLFDASVDLNPHQINAALFALNNPLSQGVVLADEVGLGKTIEAGLVLSQYWAERRRKLLIVCPASLRRQWAQELQEKFHLSCQILDAQAYRNLKKEGVYNPLSNKNVVIISYHYAVRLEEQLLIEPWDLVVMDEAHKLRNAHRTRNQMGQSLKRIFAGRKKLLLTATPLQNSLMELYGLSTVVDEHIFGDDRIFRQQYIQGEGSLQALQARLKGFVHRTLRKDVLEYVRYTQRRTLTVPFTPTPQEQRLYEGISALLEREESYALPKRQRHLIGLVLRKLQASSSFAVLNTLKTMKYRLEALQSGETSEQDLLASFVQEDEIEQDYLEESYADDPNDCVERDELIDQVLLRQEIKELDTYIHQAESIPVDSKATALLTALSQGFEQMAMMNGPQKAIVFTESKRTQAYLETFLHANGYQGKIVLFNGSNNKPAATEVYQQWLKDYQGTDRVTGSSQVDRRTALIDHFKQDAEIMIATEAAAEGVNLQFCSLIMNYDLPWNPQRVEQRIGRCHRYGQKFDVVVINFLNQANKADQRVLQLLTEKFHLFDGVFGASDSVLGSIESGLDFEKRIQSIYDTCRTPVDIEAAFDALQKELESDINQKMQQTRQLLLENFDEDIHDLLKVQLDAAEQRLDKIGRWFWSLTRHQLQGYADFDDDQYRFRLHQPVSEAATGDYQLIRRGRQSAPSVEQAYTYRLTHPLGEWVIEQAKSKRLEPARVLFDYTAHPAKISVIERLIGKSGTLTLQKYTIESLERSEDHLLFAAVGDEGVAIPSEVANKLMQLPAQVMQMIPESDFHHTHIGMMGEALETDRNRVMKSVNDRNMSFFEQEVIKLDTWADDLKESLEHSISERDKEIKRVRREAKIAATLEEKLTMQKQQRKLESLRNKQRRALFDKQDEVDERREQLIDTLEQKLNRKTEIEDLFTIQWSVQ